MGENYSRRKIVDAGFLKGESEVNMAEMKPKIAFIFISMESGRQSRRFDDDLMLRRWFAVISSSFPDW